MVLLIQVFVVDLDLGKHALCQYVLIQGKMIVVMLNITLDLDF